MKLIEWIKKNKIKSGFLLAPPIASISFLIFFCLSIAFCILFGIHYNPASAVVLPFLAGVVGIPASYFFALVIGWPYVRFMRKRGLLNLTTVMIPVVLFSIMFAVFSRYLVTGVTNETWLFWSAYAFTGTAPWIILSGVAFYWISVRN